MSSLSEPERWQRVQTLCEIVEPFPESEWAARLESFEPDAAIRNEALDLLRALQDEAQLRQLHQGVTGDDDGERARRDESLPFAIGDVTIESMLGSGGSGEVYAGVRTLNGTRQRVAVKRFHTHRATTDDLTRFAREQQVLATLTHPAIVRFYGAGTTTEGRPYIVMELAAGQSIVAYCDFIALPLERRLHLMLQVLEAVHSAHRHGILHLDLKPSNIIVTSDKQQAYVKLVDFGTAKLADPGQDATSTEPLTVQYASPERLRRDDVSAACDVYSLGLVMFELLSGGWPFPRPESIVAMAARASGTARPRALTHGITEEGAYRRGLTADRLRAALRGDLEAIVSKATAHDPAQRYASVAEFADDVKRYLAGEHVLARAPRLGTGVSRWVRKNARPLAVAVFVATLLTAGGLYLLRQPPQKPDGVVGNPPKAGNSRSSFYAPGDAIGIYTFDDFEVSQRTEIRRVTWRGTYCSPVVSTFTVPVPTATGFSVGFHVDREGNPNRDAPLHRSTYPISRVSETFHSAWQARCGANATGQTEWALFTYAVALDTPFVAEPGVRYWLNVQAQLREGRGSPKFLSWGWSSQPQSNDRSILVNRDNSTVVFDTDRAWTLEPSRYIKGK